MIPRARIARVSWWRWLLACIRGIVRRDVKPVNLLAAPTYPAYTPREQAVHEQLLREGLHLHVFGKRCPDCTPELVAMRTPREEIEFEIQGIAIEKPMPSGYVRPAPTVMPGELERRS